MLRPRAAGAYTTSTRSRSLAEDGYVHCCSFAEQAVATAFVAVDLADPRDLRF